MTSRIEERIGAAMAGWARGIGRRAAAIVAALGVAAAAAGVYALLELRVNSDNTRLLSPDLPFQQAARDFEARFPSLTDALLLVVDGETPELAREAAEALARALGERREAFREVFVPGGEAFFEERGLLYRSVEELDEFADQLARMQPLLAELSRDPSLPNLARMIRTGLDHLADDPDSQPHWPVVLESLRRGTVGVFEEHPIAVSWESVLLEGSSFDPRRRRVVVARPVLRFDRLLPAGPAIAAVREVAASLELNAERGVQVRITGYPALNHDEMWGVARDVGMAGLATLLLVAAVLLRALRSARLVAAALLTLIAGLLFTAAFAAASVGQLNLVSIAFAVLIVGLGVDFAIHLGLHFQARQERGAPPRQAVEGALEEVGGALVLCTATTAIGFYAFVPTDYRGVAELGLIAGTGMLLIFALTVSLFPALLCLWPPPRPAPLPSRASLRSAFIRAAERHPGRVCFAACLAVLSALPFLVDARFDSNVVRMRDPGSESVQAFDDLLADGESSPWYIDVLAADASDARSRGQALAALAEVERVMTLEDFVPAEQAEKLELLEDLSFLLGSPSPGESTAEGLGTEEQVAALEALADALAAARLEAPDSALRASADELRRELLRFLQHVASAAEPTRELARLEQVLLARLPERLARLERALNAPAIALADLPPKLVSRMRAADGSARIQVFPAEDVSQSVPLARFVAAVRTLEPEATGLPVNIVEFGRATSSSLRQALAGALAAMALLLLALWRSARDALRVLAPLAGAGILLVASMVALDMPFNFANVIVLPLLLGIGVDSGVHLVSRWRSGASLKSLSESPTARGVFYSGLTTVASFGSLAFSAHRGIASLGQLLVMGMALTLLFNLGVLPALLALAGPRGGRELRTTDGEAGAAESSLDSPA